MKISIIKTLSAAVFLSCLVQVIHAQAPQVPTQDPKLVPVLTAHPILFVTRPPFRIVHGPDETMFQPNEPEVARYFQGGGALKALDVASGNVRTIIETIEGIVRDPVVSFDGKRILFSMRKEKADTYHLYEINPDGTGLKQLTSAPNVSDLQPVYLPDGKIMFSSTREPKYIQCQRNLMVNLFLMEGDGANIRQISHDTLFEGRGSLMPDGRVLYSRWEYVDKHFSSAYGLWTTNPDGTSQSLLFGGLAWQPGAMMDGRTIPGTDKIVCVYGSIHGPESGALVIVDPAKGNDGPAPIVRSWPADLTKYLTVWNTLGRIPGSEYDSFLHVPIKYQSPYPLSDTHILCSRIISPKNQKMALFLVNAADGSETLVHEEKTGCFQPVLLAPQVRPPVIPNRTNPGDPDGLFYVCDVYRGAGMEAVPKGTVKALRIVEVPAKLTHPPMGIGDWAAPDDFHAHHPVATNWNQYNTKRVLGTVPVEPDGSAYFAVPAGKFVYFQLLDSEGRMIHSMRSGTTLQPGERQGCIGCHDYRSAPPATNTLAALRREPTRIKPPIMACDYAAEIQPILNRHCVKCHDYGTKAGEKINLSGDRGVVFNASYLSLMASSPGTWNKDTPKPLVCTVGAGPLPSLPPYAWGSTRSRLADILRTGHEEVELTDEERRRIFSWIDLNAPFYPNEQDAFSHNTYGRSPLNHTQLLKLGRLTGKWHSVTDYTGGQLTLSMKSGKLPVNFTRPERSACLQPGAPWHDEALALIQTGKTQADAATGIHPDDQKQLDFHQKRMAREKQVLEAIADKKKIYDH